MSLFQRYNNRIVSGLLIAGILIPFVPIPQTIASTVVSFAMCDQALSAPALEFPALLGHTPKSTWHQHIGRRRLPLFVPIEKRLLPPPPAPPPVFQEKPDPQDYLHVIDFDSLPSARKIELITNVAEKKMRLVVTRAVLYQIQRYLSGSPHLGYWYLTGSDGIRWQRPIAIAFKRFIGDGFFVVSRDNNLNAIILDGEKYEKKYVAIFLEPETTGPAPVAASVTIEFFGTLLHIPELILSNAFQTNSPGKILKYFRLSTDGDWAQLPPGTLERVIMTFAQELVGYYDMMSVLNGVPRFFTQYPSITLTITNHIIASETELPEMNSFGTFRLIFDATQDLQKIESFQLRMIEELQWLIAISTYADIPTALQRIRQSRVSARTFLQLAKRLGSVGDALRAYRTLDDEPNGIGHRIANDLGKLLASKQFFSQYKPKTQAEMFVRLSNALNSIEDIFQKWYD